jgi:hypothetical protein
VAVPSAQAEAVLSMAQETGVRELEEAEPIVVEKSLGRHMATYDGRL